MKLQAWLARLKEQLPGWHVWYMGGGGNLGRGYCATPAPADINHTDALYLPNRVGPVKNPKLLREMCRERYGWDETCESCNELARECGHRMPETRQDWNGPRGKSVH